MIFFPPTASVGCGRVLDALRSPTEPPTSPVVPSRRRRAHCGTASNSWGARVPWLREGVGPCARRREERRGPSWQQLACPGMRLGGAQRLLRCTGSCAWKRTCGAGARDMEGAGAAGARRRRNEDAGHARCHQLRRLARDMMQHDVATVSLSMARAAARRCP